MMLLGSGVFGLARDTGNADFAYNAVDWLKEGEDGPRDRVLFVSDGRIETKLDVPLRQDSIPLVELQPELTRQGNNILANWSGPNRTPKTTANSTTQTPWNNATRLSPAFPSSSRCVPSASPPAK